MAALVGIGNPLLDTSINTTTAMLDKYHLNRGEAILASPCHMPLFPEVMADPNVACIPGGSALNAMRAFQWMSQRPFQSAFIGSVGQDSNGQLLKRIVAEAGVTSLFMETTAEPTGVCAVLVTDKERNLVTNLGAAEKFQHNHYLSPLVQKYVTDAKVLYTEGFFLTVSCESLVAIGEHASATNKPFAFNLSAEFLITVDPFFQSMQKVMPYVDFLFCNHTEALTFGKRLSFSQDLEVLAQQIANLPKKNMKRQRTVIITRGAEATIVCYTGKVLKMAVPRCTKEEIVDTNGAGDSFVGGFLSELVPGVMLDDIDIRACVRSAQYCAMQCIKVAGCNFHGLPQYKTPSALFAKAATFAACKHAQQRRKGGSNEPFVNHPLGVATILTEAGVTDSAVLQAALLHDTVEDTNTKPLELECCFGPKVASIVQEVSDDKALPKAERKKQQVAHAANVSQEAKLVKLADKIHNLESLLISSPWDVARTEGYFIWAYFVCQGLFGLNNLLDARVKTVFLACPPICAALQASPADAILAQLQPALDAYYVAMSTAAN
eukprot:TRINITY_DN2802_c0_g1_i1.p1 TRINITY_DN2802_c0_g1~~TRINITY_DN2802_c0_g1_i1.p1  ORF type:complete len:550 (-),score=182.50 TRINITY_DN2802_c0_g1_i1:91-1740(-)